MDRSKPHVLILENVDSMDSATGEDDDPDHSRWIRQTNSDNKIGEDGEELIVSFLIMI